MYKRFDTENLKEVEKIFNDNLSKLYNKVIKEISQLIGTKPHVKIDEYDNTTDIYLEIPFSLKKSELNIKVDRTFEIINEE